MSSFDDRAYGKRNSVLQVSVALLCLGGCGTRSSAEVPAPGTATDTAPSETDPTGVTAATDATGATAATGADDGSDNTGPGGAAACDAAVGFTDALPVCSESSPCDALATLENASVAATPTKVPNCRTSRSSRPQFDDGPAEVATGTDGTARHTCVHRPAGAAPDSPRPLLLWFHGAFGTSDDLYNATSLRSRADDYDLSGDPERPGFVLASVQGRNLRWPTEDPRDGSHHDIYHRDLSVPSGNPDVANVDRLIDALVEEGSVDPSAIYVMGWSNGGFFAELYAIARHEVATPGGNRVAAGVAYTAADPFHEAQASATPSCRLDPYPTSSVPLMLVSRACDIIACSEAQATKFRDAGDAVAPGAVVDTWEADLSSRVGTTLERIIIDGSGAEVGQCTAPGLCLYSLAAINHLRWPDGVADRGGIDHEPAMLDFLGENPLP